MLMLQNPLLIIIQNYAQHYAAWVILQKSVYSFHVFGDLISGWGLELDLISGHHPQVPQDCSLSQPHRYLHSFCTVPFAAFLHLIEPAHY